MTSPIKNIVEDVLSVGRVRTLWSTIYLPALPFVPQSFDVGGLMPAMLYMARRGYRRGKGNFAEKFGQNDGEKRKIRPPRIVDVVHGLLKQGEAQLQGFSDEVAQTLLG